MGNTADIFSRKVWGECHQTTLKGVEFFILFVEFQSSSIFCKSRYYKNVDMSKGMKKWNVTRGSRECLQIFEGLSDHALSYEQSYIKQLCQLFNCGFIKTGNRTKYTVEKCREK